MCRFKSGIILKNKVVLASDGNDSHSDLLESLGIEDNNMNAMTKFIRAELVPKDNNKATDISEWTFVVDQDITPDWYNEDPKRYENEFRDAVKDYLKDKFTIICGMAWNPIKRDGNRIYYLMDGYYMKSQFGNNNNYTYSNIREKLNNSDLVKKLKEELGDKLIPIRTNLLSLDGLDDYGMVEGDILAIPTLDLYRECRKKISNIDIWWWLATPDSTPSSYGSDDVQYVVSCGGVGYGWCGLSGAVRPFFVVEAE